MASRRREPETRPTRGAASDPSIFPGFFTFFHGLFIRRTQKNDRIRAHLSALDADYVWQLPHTLLYISFLLFLRFSASRVFFFSFFKELLAGLRNHSNSFLLSFFVTFLWLIDRNCGYCEYFRAVTGFRWRVERDWIIRYRSSHGGCVYFYWSTFTIIVMLDMVNCSGHLTREKDKSASYKASAVLKFKNIID